MRGAIFQIDVDARACAVEIAAIPDLGFESERSIPARKQPRADFVEGVLVARDIEVGDGGTNIFVSESISEIESIIDRGRELDRHEAHVDRLDFVAGVDVDLAEDLMIDRAEGAARRPMSVTARRERVPNIVSINEAQSRRIVLLEFFVADEPINPVVRVFELNAVSVIATAIEPRLDALGPPEAGASCFAGS